MSNESNAQANEAQDTPEVMAPETAAFEAELAKSRDELLRALAEVENPRRRAERQTNETRAYAIDRFARDLLPVADTLTRFFDRPVIDATGLKGTYDLTLDLAPEDYGALMVRSALNAGVVLPPQALRLLDAASGDPLSGPLRKLGLTFDARKAPLDIIVVEEIGDLWALERASAAKAHYHVLEIGRASCRERV